MYIYIYIYIYVYIYTACSLRGKYINVNTYGLTLRVRLVSADPNRQAEWLEVWEVNLYIYMACSLPGN